MQLTNFKIDLLGFHFLAEDVSQLHNCFEGREFCKYGDWNSKKEVNLINSLSN